MTRAEHIMSKIAQNEVNRKTTTSDDGKTTKQVATATIKGAIPKGRNGA